MPKEYSKEYGGQGWLEEEAEIESLLERADKLIGKVNRERWGSPAVGARYADSVPTSELSMKTTNAFLQPVKLPYLDYKASHLNKIVDMSKNRSRSVN